MAQKSHRQKASPAVRGARWSDGPCPWFSFCPAGGYGALRGPNSRAVLKVSRAVFLPYVSWDSKPTNFLRAERMTKGDSNEGRHPQAHLESRTYSASSIVSVRFACCQRAWVDSSENTPRPTASPAHWRLPHATGRLSLSTLQKPSQPAQSLNTGRSDSTEGHFWLPSQNILKTH